MSDNIARKNVEQSRNNGIINCPTQLHLVGHFYKICITMHGSLNVKTFLDKNSTLWPYMQDAKSLRGKGKGNVHPRTGHESPERENRYSSSLSLTSSLDAGGWSKPRPDRFTPGKDPVHIVQEATILRGHVLMCTGHSLFATCITWIHNKQHKTRRNWKWKLVCHTQRNMKNEDDKEQRAEGRCLSIRWRE